MLWEILTKRDWTPYTVVGLLATFVAVVIAITVHEFAHALSAKSYGDDTAEYQGRLTLNPVAHYDPIGSTLFLLFGFGWAKPVPVNPNRMKRPRLDAIRCALWGPLSNILIALGCGLVIRFVPALPYWLAGFLGILIFLNLYLAIFNQIPFPPLDGTRVNTNMMPVEKANRWERFAQSWGFLILLGIVFFFQRVFWILISLPTFLLASAMTGLSPHEFQSLIYLFS
jgi:Zn-dependent protease